MDLPVVIESEDVQSARARAAKAIQKARDAFEQSDVLTGNCPLKELLYGVGKEDAHNCPLCKQSKDVHAIASQYLDGDNLATALQRQVQKQIAVTKQDKEYFHPASKSAITYGVTRCVDLNGDIHILLTCSGEATPAVEEARKILAQESTTKFTWISTIPDDRYLQRYTPEGGHGPVKLEQFDSPPNVCAATKLVQYIISKGWIPIDLTEVYGQSGHLKPSCQTCTNNLIQTLCGVRAARKTLITEIDLRLESEVAEIISLEEREQTVSSWRDEREFKALTKTGGNVETIFEFLADTCGAFENDNDIHESLLDLMESQAFVQAFKENPTAYIPITVEREVIDASTTSGLTKEDKKVLRQKKNKAEKRDAQKAKQGQKGRHKAKEESDDDSEEEKKEPPKTWKQLILETKKR